MRKWTLIAKSSFLAALLAFPFGAQGCGGESGDTGSGARADDCDEGEGCVPEGGSCESDDDCVSDRCEEDRCEAVAGGAEPGEPCDKARDCASGICESGECQPSDSGDDGEDDPTGTAADASTPSPSSGGPATGVVAPTPGPQFEGAGTGFRPLIAGCGPETADECTGTCEQAGGSGGGDVTVVRDPATICFYAEGIETPVVTVEQVVEAIDEQEYIHLRVTFSPGFVDNTYGEGSIGWPPKRGHRWDDLTKSDHVELRLTNGSSETVMHFKVDYVTEEPNTPCGYGTLGVSGGDGSMILGDPAHVLNVTTSITRNLNHCGFDMCYIEDSPLTDENFTPNPDAPEWDFRAVYEVWIAADAFGEAGFGEAYITHVHASPAKTPSETLEVKAGPCPPDWDEPYCPEGAACEPPPPPPPGAGDDGGTVESCPPNYTIYLSTEGRSSCVPIPFAGYPNMAPCPEGYYLDTASEGRYCLPVVE